MKEKTPTGHTLDQDSLTYESESGNWNGKCKDCGIIISTHTGAYNSKPNRVGDFTKIWTMRGFKERAYPKCKSNEVFSEAFNMPPIAELKGVIRVIGKLNSILDSTKVTFCNAGECEFNAGYECQRKSISMLTHENVQNGEDYVRTYLNQKQLPICGFYKEADIHLHYAVEKEKE